MKNIAIIIFLFVYNLGYSQNDLEYVDNQVDDFTTKLIDRGIDTYFYTKRYCLGQEEKKVRAAGLRH